VRDKQVNPACLQHGQQKQAWPQDNASTQTAKTSSTREVHRCESGKRKSEHLSAELTEIMFILGIDPEWKFTVYMLLAALVLGIEKMSNSLDVVPKTIRTH
jgi:hypothetical protein